MTIILGDGLLGSSVIGLSGWDYVSRSRDGFDINKTKKLNSLLPKSTKTIINLIANTDTYSTDIDAMFQTNYRAVVNLVDFCNEKDIKLVHFSTDYVYEKSVSNAKETDRAIPTTPYAMSKLLADEYIIKHSKNYLILRGAQKVDPFPYESAFTNLIGNFDYPDTIAEIVISMVINGATGVYNIGTPTKSMFDLAKRSNRNVKAAIAPDHFPKDVTMDLTKMEEFLKDRYEND
jgi:dTDP-4-dehydrorhamnose reductase